MSLSSQSYSDHQLASELFRMEMDFRKGVYFYVIPQHLKFVPSHYEQVLEDNRQKANNSWITWRDREVAEAMYKRQLEEIMAKSIQAAKDRALAKAMMEQ